MIEPTVEVAGKGEGLVSTARPEAAARSALWAAWADALGWISERTDEYGLKKRLRGRKFGVIGWRRRIGGRGGVDVDLPAGTWSDDTQLRLALGRGLSPRGFDVEAFSRVELTIWPAYAFGGGIASKAAATALAKPGARWSKNTAEGYTNAGGNGVAMRIQPHAWRGTGPGFEQQLLLDVMRDAVTTHGHPRAIIGAAFHALCVADLMPGGQQTLLEGTSSWPDLLHRAARVVDLPDGDPELATFWLPQWGREGCLNWRSAANGAVEELTEDAARVATAVNESDDTEVGYRKVVELLDLQTPMHRGSGSRTPIAALALLALARRHDESAEEVLTTAASLVGTDTDTIATMAGALLGALASSDPPQNVLDQEYIVSEARRIAAPGGPREPSLRYPDLLTWQPPQTQADALLAEEEHSGRLCVSGLGGAEPLADLIMAARGDFAWQWVRLDIGQTLLIKRRAPLPAGQSAQRTAPASFPARKPSSSASYNQEEPDGAASAASRSTYSTSPRQDDAVTIASTVPATPSDQSSVAGNGYAAPDVARSARALAEALEWVRSNHYDVRQIGLMLVRLATDQSPEVASMFGAIIAAEISRLRRPRPRR